MSSYDGAKTSVRVRSAYSEEFEVKIGVYQRSMLLRLLFAIVEKETEKIGLKVKDGLNRPMW